MFAIRKALTIAAFAVSFLCWQSDAAYAGIWQSDTPSGGDAAYVKMCVKVAVSQEGLDEGVARRSCLCTLREMKKILSEEDYRIFLKIAEIITMDVPDEEKGAKTIAYIQSLQMSPDKALALAKRMQEAMPQFEKNSQQCKP